ncbi:MAG TPA: PQQ-binding-like beta-propeller repeat protein [Pirellulaceae bacterium]|nr:PQQ-binding-like beta-propeller repeat protein [Pirellulaceae bacterium]
MTLVRGGILLGLIGLALLGMAGVYLVAADSTPQAAKQKIPLDDWPQWRGVDRSGVSPDSGLNTDWAARPPKLLWTAEGLGGGFASVSLASGVIYTTGNFPDGQAVVAVDAEGGKLLWKQPITDEPPSHSKQGSRSTPSIDGKHVYAIASSGKIVCLNAADGSEVWSKDFKSEWGGRMMSGWGFSESPLVDGDWVLCTPGGAEAMIVALDKLTGKEIWRCKAPAFGPGKEGAGYSSIVISNACGVKQYVQLVGKGLMGARASDGKFLWGYSDIANRTANCSTPLISGDYIFCSTGYRTGAALVKLVKSGDSIEAQEQYFKSGEEFQNHHGQMILQDGYVYAGHGHNNGLPICLELDSGKVVWGGTDRGVGTGSAAVACADGHLVFRYQSGEVALIEATPSEFRLKGSFKPQFVGRDPCWAQPVIIGGKLYLRDQDKLMCYDAK